MCGISAKSEFVSEKSRINIAGIIPQIKELKKQLMKNISEDAKAFEGYMAASASGLTGEERIKAVQAALKYAAEVPLETAILSSKAIKMLHKIKNDLSPRIMSDYFAAERLLNAAIDCSGEIVKLNLKYLKDRKAANEIRNMLEQCRRQ